MSSHKMSRRKISRCQQDFIEIIYEVANVVGLHDIEYIVDSFDDIDTFCGGVHKVQIKGISDGQKIKSSFIIKWHPDSKKRKYFKESYKREFLFYEEIVPNLLKIQKSFKVIEGLKIKFPKCVFSRIEQDKEAIVVYFSNDGFEYIDRFHKTDFDHAVIVLKYLAKLHALSFVFEKTNPTTFENIKKECGKDVLYSDPTKVTNSLKCFYKASVNVVLDPIAKKKLMELEPQLLLILNKCTIPDKYYSTICHADCWNNNVKFKHQGNRPVDVVLLDYQVARYASPVTDISYFLYMSTEQELLSQHHDKLLTVYYGTLAAVLRQCNLDVNEVYPKHVFKEHLKEYSVLGLVEALVAMKIITADYDDALQMIEVRNDFRYEDVSNKQTKNQYYIDRVNGVVNDFFSREYSLDAILNR